MPKFSYHSSGVSSLLMYIFLYGHFLGRSIKTCMFQLVILFLFYFYRYFPNTIFFPTVQHGDQSHIHVYILELGE